MRLLGLLAFWVGMGWFPVAAQAVLEPPYGLKWGDSPETLIEWASRHSLDVTISLPGDQSQLRVVTIAPRKGFLPGTKAGSVEGRFMGGKLFEVAVHYWDADASAVGMKARFEELKKELGGLYGELKPNQQERSIVDQFITRKQAYHREPVKGLFLLLGFTEVEDVLRKSKAARFSLIYRNDNFRKEVVEMLKTK